MLLKLIILDSIVWLVMKVIHTFFSFNFVKDLIYLILFFSYQIQHDLKYKYKKLNPNWLIKYLKHLLYGLLLTQSLSYGLPSSYNMF